MSKFEVHQIRINFHVTEQIKRFVYVYIIESDFLYMIDSGVFGCEKQIKEYLDIIGRKVSEIKGIFLTHAHPDHIGSAAWFQNNCGCRIYASAGEKPWIEDIGLQFKERPIPNFYKIAGQSCRVDAAVMDRDVIKSHEGLEITVLGTAGHSRDDVSYRVGQSLFIGDAVPVKGDIPIFIDENAMRRTLQVLENIQNVSTYFPAWDQPYSRDAMINKLHEASDLVDLLQHAVKEEDGEIDLSALTDRVCDRLQLPLLKANPLFKRTIACLRNGR